MSDTPNPMMRYVDVLHRLAEARFEQDEWYEWWGEHGADVERVCKPGWLARLKPKDYKPDNIHRPMYSSQGGAIYILDALGVPYQASDRYAVLWKAEDDRIAAEYHAKRDARIAAFAPPISLITVQFPKFGRFLKRRMDEIEEIEPGMSDVDLADAEARLGVPIPEAYKKLLRCTQGVWIRELDLRSHHLFIHESPKGVQLPTEGMLCFGEYWVDGDGDQVLFDVKDTADDPPVYYYSHEDPKVKLRRLAPTFTQWIESISRAKMFR